MRPASKFVFINARKDADDSPESRFRDRRGREHYDNGRFAPMRSAYDSHEDYRMNYPQESEHETESRFRDRRGREHYDDGRFAPMRGAASDEFTSWHDPMKVPAYGRYAPVRSANEHRMNMIGFDRHHESEDEDRMEYRNNYRAEYEPPRMHEMEHRTSPRMAGHAAGAGGMDLTPEKAKEWVRRMQNEDGTKGEHWSIDQVKRLMQQKGMELDPVKVWVAMNAMYSDLCKVNERHGISSPEYYLDAAVAFWIRDTDAVKDKLGAYYECVVKH